MIHSTKTTNHRANRENRQRKKQEDKKLIKKNTESKLTCKLPLDVILAVVEILLCYKKWLTSHFVMVARKYLSVAKVKYQVTNATTTK
jgi:hypothetical protein